MRMHLYRSASMPRRRKGRRIPAEGAGNSHRTERAQRQQPYLNLTCVDTELLFTCYPGTLWHFHMNFRHGCAQRRGMAFAVAIEKYRSLRCVLTARKGTCALDPFDFSLASLMTSSKLISRRLSTSMLTDQGPKQSLTQSGCGTTECSGSRSQIVTCAMGYKQRIKVASIGVGLDLPFERGQAQRLAQRCVPFEHSRGQATAGHWQLETLSAFPIPCSAGMRRSEAFVPFDHTLFLLAFHGERCCVTRSAIAHTLWSS